MQFLLLTPVRHASLCHAQWAEKVVKLESVNLEFVFICFSIGQTVKVNLECAEPARCVWLLRKLAPILQSVHTDRCVRPPTILTVLLLLKCLCVRASSTFSPVPGHLRWEAQSALTVQFATDTHNGWTANIRDGVEAEIQSNQSP